MPSSFFSVYRILFTLFALIQSGFVYSQNNPYWIQNAGGFFDDYGNDIAVDGNNNVYTIGTFTGAIDFDSTFNLYSNGSLDVFICKNDSLGYFKWAIKAGGLSIDEGLSIKTDPSGNIYVTGFFTQTATFEGTQIVSNGSQDMFVAKYNSNGNLQWVKSGGGPQNDVGNAIAIDNSGNVIVTGQFSETAQFDSFTLNSMVDPSTSVSSVDVFTVKYNSSGSILWAKKGSSKYTDRGLDVGCDPLGNIYVTGQFSDTVLFDNLHYNSIYNAIFLIKYDGNGNEQWFTKAGGGTTNISYGLAVNNNGNIFITGDFQGNVIFFGTSLTTLSTSFTQGIFVAKYNSNGDLVWVKSSGSDNEFSSRNIALDDSSNAYIIGNYKCVLSEYSNYYGHGYFNTVGYNDIFISKFDSSGSWLWARNYGGQYDDYGNGICVNNFYQPIITGSYQNLMLIPVNSDFIHHPHQSFPGGSHHLQCLDSASYGFQLRNNGLNDFFILNSLNPDIKPFYYFSIHGDSLCQGIYQGVSIDRLSANSYDDLLGPDTIAICDTGRIVAHTLTSPVIDNGYYTSESQGPAFNYLWSTGSTARIINVITSGNYWVKMTSIDGCFTSYDTVFVLLNPLPALPIITDSKGVNVNTSTPQIIHLCQPDSVLITIDNPGNNSVLWYDNAFQIQNGINYNYYTNSLGLNWTKVEVTDSNGCKNNTVVYFDVDTALSQTVPKIKLRETNGVHLSNDTISVCDGGYLQFYVYDSLTNPTGIYFINCHDSIFANTIDTWTASPAFIFHTTGCQVPGILSTNIQFSDNLQLSCKLIGNSPCGGNDSITIYKDYFVLVNPDPTVTATITGDSIICPNDSTTLTASPGQSYTWTSWPPGLIHVNSHLQTLQVFEPGRYMVSIRDSNVFGCYAVGAAFINVAFPDAPVITMNPSNGLICPGDSVQLIAVNSLSYDWQGPAGTLIGNSSIQYATTPGNYLCIGDSTTCFLTSNIVEVKQYSTPFLQATPNAVICPGSTVRVDIITNDSSIIQWQSPFSGNDPFQIINAPGVYSCLVTSCGITTNASVTITPSNISASIIPPGPLNFCQGDSAILTANSGMVNYLWSPVTSNNLFIVVNQSGNYSVTVTDGYGCTAISPQVIVTVNNGFPNPVIVSNSPLCIGDTLVLNSNYPTATNIQWSGPNGFSSTASSPSIPNITIADSGIYSVNITNGTCNSIDTIDISIESQPEILLSIPELCLNSSAIISASEIPGAGYSWLAPSGTYYLTNTLTFSAFQYTDTGMYNLVVSSGHCTKNLHFNLSINSCSFQIPNVFTPNNDGLNDYFKIENVSIETIDCKIYNRWGKLIYTWDSPLLPWDGTNQNSGNKANDGVYFYVMNIKLLNEEPEIFKGIIELIRN